MHEYLSRIIKHKQELVKASKAAEMSKDLANIGDEEQGDNAIWEVTKHWDIIDRLLTANEHAHADER